MAQQIKDPRLSLLWHRFNPIPGNFHMPWAWPKKKKKLTNKDLLYSTGISTQYSIVTYMGKDS